MAGVRTLPRGVSGCAKVHQDDSLERHHDADNQGLLHGRACHHGPASGLSQARLSGEGGGGQGDMDGWAHEHPTPGEACGHSRWRTLTMHPSIPKIQENMLVELARSPPLPPPTRTRHVAVFPKFSSSSSSSFKTSFSLTV